VVVLGEDECHLRWGDCCGYVWGKRGQAIEVPMTNQRERQTYYGAVNYLDKTVHLKAFSAGNSENTIIFLTWLLSLYPNKRLILLWDGASYHRDNNLKAFLAQLNAGLTEGDWRLTLIRFAPHAPEQNPVEDIWLAGKNYLRRQFAKNKTFAQVKASFSQFLDGFSLHSVKFSWYLNFL
jgi:transposase